MNNDPTHPANRQPTKKELQQLPRWARVAFAVRCARRVEPLLPVLWHDVSPAVVNAVRSAIDDAKAAAAGRLQPARSEEFIASVIRYATTAPMGASPIVRAALAASSAAAAALSASAAANSTSLPRPRVVGVMMTFGSIDSSGGYPGQYTELPDPAKSEEFIAHGAARCGDAVVAAVGQKQMGPSRREHLRALIGAMRADFDTLKAMAKDLEWTDASQVDPDWLGGDWPLGPPDGWPQLSTAPEQTLEIVLRIPPMSDTAENRAALKEHIKRVIAATSAVHVAHGGSGLRIKRLEAFVPEPSGVPAGGES